MGKNCLRLHLVTIIAIVFFAFLAISSATSSSPPPIPQIMSLDKAIEFVAKDIETQAVGPIQEGQTQVTNERHKIAMLNFKSSSEQFSEYVLEELASQLVKGKKLIVVDRKELDLIRREEKFQMSGEVSDESAQAIGRKLGAQLIASGSLTKIGNSYRFRIRVLAVETAAIVAAPSIDIYGDDEKVLFLLGEISSANTGSGQTSAIASTSASSKIGTRGPAGGIIFYDKGTFSDGWRYLEAAPPQTEGAEVMWASRNLRYSAYKNWRYLRNEIGMGKMNTEYILQDSKDSEAAQFCAKMNFNGFNDWFLPNIGELELMYKNLKQKGLGGFSNNWYWSSSFDEKGYRAQYLRFKDGYKNYGELNMRIAVRAIRMY